MIKLDHNTIPLSQTDQEPDTVLVDAYGDGSAVWLGLASDDPDVLNHADLSPAEARRLAFRLFVAADAARERLIDSIAVEVAVEEAVDGNFAALAQEPQGPPQTVAEGLSQEAVDIVLDFETFEAAVDPDPEATRIIRDALAILGSQGSVARNWLINADGRVPFPRELPAGPGATCCLDGALNLAAFKTTPAEVASLNVAVQGRSADDDDVPAALRRAKARVRDAADTGSILYINGQGYDAAVAALERAL